MNDKNIYICVIYASTVKQGDAVATLTGQLRVIRAQGQGRRKDRWRSPLNMVQLHEWCWPWYMSDIWCFPRWDLSVAVTSTIPQRPAINKTCWRSEETSPMIPMVLPWPLLGPLTGVALTNVRDVMVKDNFKKTLFPLVFSVISSMTFIGVYIRRRLLATEAFIPWNKNMWCVPWSVILPSMFTISDL